MAVTAKKLLEERAEIITKARKINDDHADAQGNLPAEHQQAFDAAMKEAGEKMVAAKRLQALEEAEANLGERFNDAPPQPNPGERSGASQAAETISLRSYNRTEAGLPRYEQVAVGDRGARDYRDSFARALRGGRMSSDEFAALQSDNSEQAGYLVASEQFAAGLLQEVDDLLFIRQHATVHTVREADSLGIRKRTSRANTFGWTSELELSDEDNSLKFGKKVLTPHHLTGEIKVSRDLLRRSMMGVEQIVRGEMSRDAGEKMEDAYLTGSGSQRPLGVFTPSADGISTARDVKTGSATGFLADQLVAAKYSLKQQYRTGGNRSGCRWLFHRDGIAKIAQLKDGDDHYLLHPARGLTGDEFDTLLGYPIDESERAPNTFTDAKYVGLLAQWRYYEIADALDLEVAVLEELYQRTNQIGFIGRLKTDGMPTLEEAFVRLKTGTL